MSNIQNKKKEFQSFFEKFSYWTMPMLYLFAYLCIVYFQNPWFFVMFIYYLMPVLDKFLTMDEQNPTFEQQQELRKDFFYKYPVYCNIIFEWIYSIWSTYWIQENQYSWCFFIGLLLQSQILAVSNINVCHELMHKTDKIESNLAQVSLLRNFYTHFHLEHTKGHHQNVSTPNDPASAKFNQTIFQFFNQTLYGTMKSALEIENDRLKEKNLSQIHNNIIFYWIVQIFFTYFLFKIFQVSGALFFISNGFMSIIFLEIINYIEHYGLERKQISPGVYEKVTVMHSWNAPYRLSNAIMFKLQRHSDHHENAYKEYQTLCSYQSSPLLPQSYSVLIILTLFPTKWFEILNPIVESYNKNGKLLPEIQKKTDQLLNKFLAQAGLGIGVFAFFDYVF